MAFKTRQGVTSLTLFSSLEVYLLKMTLLTGEVTRWLSGGRFSGCRGYRGYRGSFSTWRQCLAVLLNACFVLLCSVVIKTRYWCFLRGGLGAWGLGCVGCVCGGVTLYFNFQERKSERERDGKMKKTWELYQLNLTFISPLCPVWILDFRLQWFLLILYLTMPSNYVFNVTLYKRPHSSSKEFKCNSNTTGDKLSGERNKSIIHK